MTQYRVYDVFTDRPFGGNQLAVFPDARAIAEERLMPLCHEFNFSEVVYLYPPDDPASTARVRIFSPTREMAFAGHPTIGAAVALNDMGHGSDLVLELGIGPVACHVGADGAAFTVSRPLERLGLPDPALVAACLSLDTGEVTAAAHPPEIASVGNPFVLVELPDIAALTRARPRTDAMQEVLQAHPESLDCSIYAYVRTGDGLRARMFGALGGIPEDPATGSAAAALAAYLAAGGEVEPLVIHQGIEMGRPSLIRAETGPAGVTITGQAVLVMEGELTI